MMSFFCAILRSIFCREDEESPLMRESLSQCDYTRVPNDDSISHTISPATFNPSSNRCSSAPTISTSRTIHYKSYPNSSNVPTFCPREPNESKLIPTEGIRKGSSTIISQDIPQKTLERFNKPNNSAQLPTSLPFPKLASTSSATSKPTLSSTSEEFHDGTSKMKVSPLSSSLAKTFQHDKTNPGIFGIKRNNCGVARIDASQRTSQISHESYDQKPKDLPASSYSVKSFPIPSSVLQKSSEISQKSTDSPSSIAPYYYSQTKETNPRTNKTFEHILSHDVSSASSQTSESFPKLPALSNSSRPSISTYEHPPSNPENYRKNHIWVEKGASPTSLCPENFTSLIEKDDFPASSNHPRTSVFISEHPPSSPAKDSLSYSSPNRACLSAKLPPLSIKPTISLASSNPRSLGKKVNYIWVEKGASPTYLCPEDFKSLIEKDIVPGVLKKPLSMSTYKEYFQALLYAEDIYIEKWDGFEMKNVTLQLHDATIHMRKGKSKILNGVKNVEKTFVKLEIDKIPERGQFLLSRDFLTVRPLIKKNKTCQGIIYRVRKSSNLVIAEFGEDFHSQHDTSVAYDVKFSFNRVCLKRVHQAISDASDDLFRNFLFPNFIEGNKLHRAEPSVDHKVGGKEACALRQILTLQGSPPHLVEGPLSRSRTNQLSETGVFVVKTLLQICRASSSNRILLCAPTNNTCDMFMRGLKKEIPESDMFRANAAFRELDGVPVDILPSCLYETEQECFSCPSLDELCKFKVILSTFMSSFRLHNQGIMAGHFSHIFLVDASSVTEPEALVPLANFANEKTTVIITGAPGNHSGWIRSTMAWQNGLGISYFERIRNSRLYENRDPHVITILKGLDQKSGHTCGSSFC